MAWDGGARAFSPETGHADDCEDVGDAAEGAELLENQRLDSDKPGNGEEDHPAAERVNTRTTPGPVTGEERDVGRGPEETNGNAK